MKGTAARRMRRVVTVVVAAVLAAPALAMFSMPTNAPVARLVGTLTKVVKERPTDSNAVYMLGRVHAMAFANKSREVPVWERGGSSDVPEVAWKRGGTDKNTSPPLTSTELLTHASESVKHLQHAVEMADTDAHYHLGLAAALDQASLMALDTEFMPTLPGKTAPTVSDARKKELQTLVEGLGNADEKEAEKAQASLLKSLDEAAVVLREKRDALKGPAKGRARQLLSRYWLRLARAEYYKAYELMVKSDTSGTKEQPLSGLSSLISYEAGRATLKLDKADPPESKEGKAQHGEVAAAVKHFDDLPPCNAMTPIILPLTDKVTELSDLTDDAACVPFALDGTTRAQRWSWVRPSAGLLVWDPDGTGAVSSGRDLFGAVTWWLLPGDGFTALDLLDDNRDGWLTGPELAGLAVWIDRDSDGVCDKGEVVTLASLGVEGLRSRADCMTGDAQTASGGVRLVGGRTRPLYDWIAHSKPAPGTEHQKR